MNSAGRIYLSFSRLCKRLVSQRPNQEKLTERYHKRWKNGEVPEGKALLAETLSHAAAHVPFYRDYFASRPDLDPHNIQDWPVLSRDLLRGQFQSLQSEQRNAVKTWTHASGGSTGQPVAVVHDENFAAKAQALRQLCAEMFFKGPHYNKLILWGMSDEVERRKSGAQTMLGRAKLKLLALLALKATHVNTFEFSPKKLNQCVEVLQKQQPSFIFGYAGSVYQLAKHIKDNNIQFPRKQVSIGTTAQTLYPFMRDTIEEVFDCRVCDHYGSREVGPIAWQHESGDMCFPELFSHIEVVDEQGNPCRPGESGRILVTTLHNRTMPLIRYDIGDLGVAGKTRIIGDYRFATLKQISGKANEEFVAEDGTLVHGQYFINLFYYRPWLDKFQVVQKDYKHVEIKYIPKGDAGAPEEDRAEIAAQVRRALSHDTLVKWHRTDRIPTTSAGKHLYVRSEVKKSMPWHTKVAANTSASI